MPASTCICLSALCGGGGGGWGEGVITSMRMRLVSSVFCCCFLCVAFRIIAFLLKHRPCKNLAFFCSFPDKHFENDAKNQLNKKQEKHGICDTFAKTLPKNKNKKHGKTKTPTHRVVDENLANYRVCLTSTKKTSQQ